MLDTLTLRHGKPVLNQNLWGKNSILRKTKMEILLRKHQLLHHGLDKPKKLTERNAKENIPTIILSIAAPVCSWTGLSSDTNPTISNSYTQFCPIRAVRQQYRQTSRIFDCVLHILRGESNCQACRPREIGRMQFRPGFVVSLIRLFWKSFFQVVVETVSLAALLSLYLDLY